MQHHANLLGPAGTLIEIGDGSLAAQAAWIWPSTAYVALDRASGRPLLYGGVDGSTLSAPEASSPPEGEPRPGKEPSPARALDRFCSSHGLPPPYVISVHDAEELPPLLDGAASILAHCELLVIRLALAPPALVEFERETRPRLAEAGLALWDVWGVRSGAELTEPTRRTTWLFAQSDGPYLQVFSSYSGDRASDGSRSSRRQSDAHVTDTPRSCLILGTGRSGTSMLSGLLYEAGYYFGENLYPGRPTNPKGFFECALVNRLNEELLRSGDDADTAYTRSFSARQPGRPRKNPGLGRRWLCALEAPVSADHTPVAARERIRQLAARQPFAYKDPRFCYTLPAWEPHLPPNTVFLCIFRHPAVTVASILKEVQTMSYLQDLDLDTDVAHAIYRLQYAQVLRYAAQRPEQFVFVHYQQILQGDGIARVSERLGVPLTPRFVDPRLQRSRPAVPAPVETLQVYQRLCEHAGLSPEEAA